MADKVNVNKVGLSIGILFGTLHLIWAILVAIGVAKLLIDWVIGLHFLAITYAIGGFDIVTALLLVVVTFVVGYIVGLIAGIAWNWVHKK